MLTIEMLRQNTTLNGLTDAQLEAVATMSKNDENTVIGTKIGALHGQYDSDVFSITGVKKNDGEKTYDFVKRVLTDLKSKADGNTTINAQLANAKKEIDNLKQKLAENAGDEQLKQQLKDTKAQVNQLQSQMAAKETEFSAAKAEFEKTIKATHVDYAFQTATSGLRFKAGIPESALNILLNSAKAEVLAKGTPDFIDDGKGNKTLIFRGADGNILNNPANNLNPFTIEEMIMQTSLRDVIDTGKQQLGAGTVSPNNAGSGGSTILDFTGVKSQVDADNVIENYLLAQGITRDSQEFSEQAFKLRTENNVAQLPIR